MALVASAAGGVALPEQATKMPQEQTMIAKKLSILRIGLSLLYSCQLFASINTVC
jgi:hypothetical protein